MEKAKKVLIISTNAIGDAYLSMSAISTLEKEYGNVNFIFVFPTSAITLKFNKGTNYKILYASKSISNFIFIIGLLFFQKFDFAFSFFPGRINTFLLKLCNSKNKAGYFNYKKVDKWDDKTWVPTILFEGKTRAGIQWDDKKNYLELVENALKDFVSERVIAKYKPFLIEKASIKSDSVILHGISRILEKSLTISQFKIIIDFLIEKGIKSIQILGSKKENEIIKNILNYEEVSYISNLTLEELVIELNNSFLLGIDSFPLHVADAYNTNFIGLFTCTKPSSVLVNSEKSYKFKSRSFSEVTDKEFLMVLEEIKINKEK